MVFRADASSKIGGGHVMRCLTLADMVGDGTPSTFVCRDLDGAVFDLIEGRGHRVIRLPAETSHWRDDAEQTLDSIGVRRFDWLVTDHYGLDARWEGAMRPVADRLMVIDDLADRPHDCDLLLDQTPGRTRTNYGGLTADTCRHLFGPSHALVGASFRNRRETALERRQSANGIRRILVSFGLMDGGEGAGLALSAIARSKLDADAIVDVVLNENAPRADAVRRQAKRLVATAHVHFSTTEMADLMAKADLAIGAAGTTSWERCCVGLPALILTTAENQNLNAEVLEKRGAAKALGSMDAASPDLLAREINAMIAGGSAVSDMARNAAEIFNINKEIWMRTEMQPLERVRDGGTVRLRRAEADDSEIAYGWQCLPETRRFSRNPLPPTREDHLKWFTARLVDHTCLLFIIEHATAPVGVLRLDARPQRDGYELSVLVAPEKWGLGIGHAALRLARQALPRGIFHAYVMPGNRRSRSMFEKAGYQPANNDWLVREPDNLERIF